MDEQKQSENAFRFKWFMSLSRKRTPKLHSSKESVNSAEKMPNANNNGVFFTLRKQFRKKLTSIKVKAYEPDLVPSDSDRLTDNSLTGNSSDFARIVIERHSQNPIRFSGHLPVISGNSNDEPVNSTATTGFDNERAPRCEITVDENATNLDSMMDQMRVKLLTYGWYWGKLTRSAAQKRLARKDNGTFLVRDSQTEKYQFTVSFRSSGITLHCRIDFKDNYWSFSGLTTPTQCETMIDLIEDTMKKSEFGVIGYVKQNSPLTPPFPVRLMKPVNRFYEVSSLQHLCRFIIRQQISTNDIASLHLPCKLKEYIEENFYDL